MTTGTSEGKFVDNLKQQTQIQGMEKSIIPVKSLPSPFQFQKGDVLIVFGQVFGKGYVNGLCEEALRQGMQVIAGVVGERNQDGVLGPASPEQMEKARAVLPFKAVINVPLEAGFDLEKSAKGQSPCDQLQGVKMDAWDQVELDWDQIHDSRTRATLRFKNQVKSFFKEVEKQVPASSRVVIAHTMAGGVPRAKILMPTMNKVFKGRKDKFVDSLSFWNSAIGKLCQLNFEDVTANTFQHLLDETAGFRERQGQKVSYLAYGYHGTEIWIGDEVRWQSYSPYLQGFAKIRLEEIAKVSQDLGIRAVVYNCPEILTNSSQLFQGIEVPLYPYLKALMKESKDHPKTQERISQCQGLLKEGVKVSDVFQLVDDYYNSPLIKNEFTQVNIWPQHSSFEQMQAMLGVSQKILDLHKNPDDTMTLLLSQDIFQSTGQVMLHHHLISDESVYWLGHDLLAKASLS